MHIAVALLPSLLPARWQDQAAAAIIIDTLRFTSTAAQALAVGASKIHISSSIERARELASELVTEQNPMALCGERHCRPIAGFHFGNSPLEYTPEKISGRSLIFSTTNGTVAVEAVKDAELVVLGSLLNRQSLARFLRSQLNDGQSTLGENRSTIWIVCAGTDGEIALEDSLTAGAIADAFLHNADGSHGGANDASLAGDPALMVHQLWRSIRGGSPDFGPAERERLLLALRSASGGRNLIESGYSSDIDFVANLDSLDAVPVRIATEPVACFELASLSRQTHPRA